VIDFHCHIDLYPDPRAVLAGADARGVYVLAVTTTPKAWSGTRKLIGDRQRVRIGLGLHPELAAERHAEVPLFEHLLGETRYVGEIGLDGSPHMKGSFAIQERVLARILAACGASSGRIMSLHSRRAASGVMDLLTAHPTAGVPILHWFSGSVKELDRAIQLGCWFSVGPIMLTSARSRALVAQMPKERVLTETDAPFAQEGGKPLMPWDVERAHPVLADIWGMSPKSVSEQLRANLRALVEKFPAELPLRQSSARDLKADLPKFS